MIEKGDWLKYASIVLKFLDSPTAPYSIHRIALQGAQFDKEVGQWFGPSTISQVLKYDYSQFNSPTMNQFNAALSLIFTALES